MELYMSKTVAPIQQGDYWSLDIKLPEQLLQYADTMHALPSSCR